jgi:hypothetical protein
LRAANKRGATKSLLKFKTANEPSLSSPNEFLREVFILFNKENDLSALQFFTAILKKILKAMSILGKVEIIPFSRMYSNVLPTEFNGMSSGKNSLKWQHSVGKSSSRSEQ